jgi:hypothetical protein
MSHFPDSDKLNKQFYERQEELRRDIERHADPQAAASRATDNVVLEADGSVRSSRAADADLRKASPQRFGDAPGTADLRVARDPVECGSRPWAFTAATSAIVPKSALDHEGVAGQACGLAASHSQNLTQKPASPIINSHGPLSEPTTAAQAWRGKPLFMAPKRSSGKTRCG